MTKSFKKTPFKRNFLTKRRKANKKQNKSRKIVQKGGGSVNLTGITITANDADAANRVIGLISTIDDMISYRNGPELVVTIKGTIPTNTLITHKLAKVNVKNNDGNDINFDIKTLEDTTNQDEKIQVLNMYLREINFMLQELRRMSEVQEARGAVEAAEQAVAAAQEKVAAAGQAVQKAQRAMEAVEAVAAAQEKVGAADEAKIDTLMDNARKAMTSARESMRST